MDDHKADRDKAPARRRPARPRAARVVLLPQLMSLAAERAPSADAVTCEGRKRSYEDLDRQSSQLARMLIGRRIGPEGLVAVALARSIESVTSVWGIAKSGAAFVPIDPGYPEDRVLHMLTDSGVAVGITTAEFRDGLPATVEWIVLDDPDTSSAISKLPDDSIAFGDRLSQLRAEHPAYVIYTSGSTGRPKGVVVTQAGLGAFCAEQVERYQLTSASRTLHFASPSFDAAVLELLLAIGASSTMVIAPDTVFGGSELAALIAEERVTHGFITPAALASVDPSGLDSVEMIVVGGEACPPELVSRWGSKCRFHNGYGPTETTIMTNISEALQPGEPVTIGRGIRGVSNQILDARLGEVPQGVAGELYLAGPGLARGYHARPSLTAARFVANPFGAPGGRLYRTGDIVRSTPKNEVEYVGRNDFQVKIRGYRIELGEIDSVLVSHPDVDFAVTVGREIGTGAQILVSYVVPTVGSIVDTAALLEHVGQSVPGYMVPTTIAVIDKIPLTPVGKLDRAALPAPTLEHAEFIEPTAGLEQTVAEVFADVLDTSPIGAHDNFFELGGNSLMATSVTARLSSILGWRIGARELFSASTVAGLAARIEAMPAGDHKSKEIVARPRPARLPLSYAQQRMWFLGQFEASSAVYNVPLVVRLVGDLDTDAINAALADVISRHESLRTIYPTIDGEPVQQILDAGDAAIEIAFAHVDSTELVPNVAEVAGRGFDLAGEIPVRVSLFEVDPSDHVLAVVIHHIACDGSSLGPLARDVMIAYEARSRGESPAFAPLPVQYADYALRQLDLLGSATDPTSVAARQIAYWREALDGIPAVLDLPADRPRPSVQSNRGESLQFALDQGAHEQLYKLAREQNSTLFMVLHAAVAVLLARLSGSADIAVGTPIAGRGDKVLEGLIGMFVNTLVLRTEVDSNISFRDLVDNVRRTDVAAFDHAELPFEWLVDELAPTRSTAHSPLFQTLLVLQNFAQTHLELPGLTLRGVEVETELAKFDLQFTLEEQFDESGSPMGISGSIIFATDLFERETATRFAARFERIVESIIANVDRKVGDIDILDADERALLASYNDTAQPIAADVTLVSLFDDQVVRTPDAVAVVFENETLTYVDLDERANKIARHLISLGVGPEIVVGVAMNRSIELVVALYAILKAGGVYVPLDPDQPAERLAHVVESAGPRAVLVVSADEAVIPASVERIEIDRIALEHVSGSRISDAERTAALRPMNTAYLIYTSGSTGQPKGVALPHAATVSQLLWAQDRYPLDGTDVVLHKTPIVFDISIWEMLWTLHTGAVMVIAAPQGHKDPFYLSQMIERHSVTTVHFVPSMLDLYLATAPAVGASLRRVFAAGEALQSDLADRFAAQSSADLHNWYGPAEVEVITAWKRSRDEQRSAMPIGRPVWNSGVYVLDSRLSHVPAGVAGELYVSGVQLARGYFGRADLTGERFVANPFAVGERLYRTGDLVRWNRFGELEYLGRTDFQVKVRGQRVELGEIESVLLAAESVARAVVVARVDPRVGSQLVGYVVPVAGAVIDVRDLREFVGTRVPSYMVPSAVVVIDEFPLTASGKVDRRALPEPVFEVRAFRVPSTPVEEIVAGVFAELLGVERVGVNDDFFELGGNSLIATRVVARLGVALDARVPVRVLFEASTVEALAVRLERHVGRGGRVALGPRMRPERVPLSLAQQRMWFLNRLEPGSAVNNIPVAVRLSGALDIEALRAAISDVVERHEVLRTVYPAIDGVGVQVVVPTSQAVPDVVPATVVEGELLAAVAGLVGAGFDVTQAVPLRVGLFALGPGEFVLVVVVHHIAGDGFSMLPLTRDVVTAYEARSRGDVPGWSPLPVQYADYALWQREVLGDESDPESLISGQLSYWRAKLAGLPDQLDLPVDRPRPVVASSRGASLSVSVAADVHRGVVELARSAGSSQFMVVHAALAVLLARLSGTSDIVVGTPVAGRGDAALDDLVGMFVNTLVLRTEVESSASFTDLVATVRETDLQAFGHADLPFERLVEVLNPARSQARHPLFQVMLAFQNMGQTSLELPGLTVSAVEFDTGLAKFDLQVTLSELVADGGGAGGFAVTFTYATDLFDESTVVSFADRFVRILSAVATDPGVAVGDIELLDAAERSQVLAEWNDTARALEPSATLLTSFDAQVESSPEAIAVVFEGSALTYAAFDSRVNRLARYLISEGVGPEARVALGMRRSLDLLVGMYAVVKAGAAYVPLDLDQPADRLEYVVETAAPVLALTTSGTDFAPQGVRVLAVDTVDLSDVSDAPIGDAERLAPLRPENLAYVIFTSGSTGRPKGVAVAHKSVVNQVRWITTEYGIAADDVVLWKTPATFDVSVWELFGALAVGARMVVAVPDGHRDPAYLAGVIATERVTMTSFVPSMLAVFSANTVAGELDSLRVVMVAGEALAGELVTALDRITDAEAFNLYGPTEFTVHATHARVAPGTVGSVPIGAPVWNSRAFVLDSRLRPVPAGVAGELYMSGVQLARGYVGRPDLTSERFVADPFVAGARMYRTGDLVRWNRHGELEYLARTDFQVKVRGLRIELGEIESALTAHESVARAVVLAREDPHVGGQLVGYVVAETGVVVDVAVLRDAVSARVPSYMVPSALLVLGEFPLNASGKLDRKALPVPVFEAKVFRAPTTPVEEIVAGTFAEILGVERVGLDDDFFELGGNSLIATQVAARLGAALDATIGVRGLFEAPTVGALAALVERHAGSGGRKALVAQHRPEQVPLSLAQQRMWFLNRIDSASAVNNIPAAIRLTGQLHVAALQAAFADVVARHEILRTLYPEVDGLGTQVIVPAAQAVPDLSSVAVDAEELVGRVLGLVSAGFDVTQAVPLRVGLFALGPGEFVLVVVVHHIAGDGFSMLPLTRDVVTAYEARSRGDVPGWSPLPVQYADYALWQREVLGDESDPESLISGQLSYWRAKLAGLPDQLDLPVDRPRPVVASSRGASLSVSVAADVHRGVVELARSAGSSQFMVVHAALAVLLARLSGTSDIVVGTPVAGRGDAALDDLVGMFVNTLVLRTEVESSASFTDLVATVRETDLQAFGHADLPFERLVEVLNPARSQARHPLFQVMLAFQNMGQTSLELPGLTVSAVEFDTGLAKFDLQVTLSELVADGGGAGGFAVTFTYATDLFDESTVVSFADRFVRILSAVATDPGVAVGDIELLDAAERSQVLAEWNDTARALEPSATLLTSFDAQVESSPEAIAVVFEGSALTYAAFDSRVNRLARYLISEGVGPEARVALGMRRSLDLLVGMYAVVKAGAAYVPLDLDQPADRLEYVVETAAPVLALTTSGTDFAPQGVRVLAVDTVDLSDVSDAPIGDAERLAPLRPENLAYVIFTSGSTGRPKGVAVAHKSVVNQVRWITTEYGIAADDVVLWKTPATFDVSVWELFGALAVGARMVVAVPDGHRDPAYLAGVIATERVTMTSFVPSMLAVFSANTVAGELDSLRVVMVAGEALAGELVTALDRITDAEAFNLYGPTEFTVHATHARVAPGTVGSVPIGAPVWNSRAFVLDSRLRPVPAGVAGELYMSGVQLARGYVGRPDLTSERFVADPFVAGARMYRTGDLVRWNRHGELEYLARTDFQVKVRGLRIELGEIESALTALDGVAQAVVSVRTDPVTGDQLVGYVVPVEGIDLDSVEMQVRLGRQLPSYMIPTAWVVLASVPLNASGKLDRKALPNPTIKTREYRAPGTPEGQAVADAFVELLGLEQVGADDDFFALGGNSLIATQVAARLRKSTGVDVRVQWFFGDATVSGLASQIVASRDSGSSPMTDAGQGVVIHLRRTGTRSPLFAIHPMIGLSWLYAGLTSEIDADRPLIGLQNPALSEPGPPAASIEELAVRYVDEITQIQPDGQICLLGYSLGGNIAHAVAVMLREQGREVSKLIMLDSQLEPEMEVFDTELTAALRGIGVDVPAGEIVRELSLERAEQIVAILSGDGLISLSTDNVQRLFASIVTTPRLMADYEPVEFDGDMFYVSASTHPEPEDAAYTWRPFVSGAIENRFIDVPHDQMMTPDAITLVGPILDEALRDCE